MRSPIALMALLLPLSGCVVPPDQVGYGYGYAPTGYPGAYAQPDSGYPGYSYYDGSPTLAVEGATVPLIFYGGNWGYWDRGHNWHHAPDNVAHNMNQRYPGGSGWGGNPAFHPQGGPPPGGGFVGHAPGGPPPGAAFVGHAPGAPPPRPGFAGHPQAPPPPAPPPPPPPLAATV